MLKINRQAGTTHPRSHSQADSQEGRRADAIQQAYRQTIRQADKSGRREDSTHFMHTGRQTVIGKQKRQADKKTPYCMHTGRQAYRQSDNQIIIHRVK